MKRSQRSRRAFRPVSESIEARTLLSIGLDPAVAILRSPPIGTHPVRPNTPVLPFGAPASTATFIDPTARIVEGKRIQVGSKDFIAPYATLDAAGGFLKIGSGSAILDNATLTAATTRTPGVTPGIVVGDSVLIQQGATVIGSSSVGAIGSTARPTLIGFNAVVDGATIAPGAIVQPLAHVGPGVTVPAGFAVLAGADVQTDAEASDPALGKVVAITADDLATLRTELSNSVSLAAGYTQLYQGNSATGASPAVPSSVTGVNNGNLAAVLGANLDPSPSVVKFEPKQSAPLFPSPHRGQVQAQFPEFRARITGPASFGSRARTVAHSLGRSDSIRSDEGQPITFATAPVLDNAVSIQSPVAGQLKIGRNFRAGAGSVILGGPLDSNTASSRIGDDVTVGPGAVVQRSSIGSGSTIGARTLVDSTTLPPGSVVPDGTILINGNVVGSTLR